MMTIERRHAVGDLDEVAHGLLEALLGIVEEAQVLDLVDAEHQRGAVDRPHQAAERLDDLEGAVLARVGIERGDRLMRQVGQLAAVADTGARAGRCAGRGAADRAARARC